MNAQSQKVWLRTNVAIEPLVDRWYAWPHLIQPATAARNLTQRHLPIMDSYLNNPDAHAAASRDPRLLGGPFMNYDSDRTAEIAILRDQTISNRQNLIELSKAIEVVELLLERGATGLSIESLYGSIPEPLSGLVELAYDLKSRPTFRFIEPLLYSSNFHDPGQQSIMLSLVRDDQRPFIFSTPRLDEPGSWHWQIPFESRLLDQLVELKRKPSSCSAISELLSLKGHEPRTFQDLLTDREPAPPSKRFEGPGVRWRYFGHACVLIESRGCAILTDPALGYAFSGASPRFTFADLPEVIDFVLLTHCHQDHVVLETLLQLRSRIGTIVVPRSSGGALQDPSLKLVLRACGFRNVIDLAEFEELSVESGAITSIPFLGEHCDLDIRSKTAYLVRFGRRQFAFVADSRNVSPELYRRVHSTVGDVETIFVGMECEGAPLSWIYGPLLTSRPQRAADQSRRAAASDCSSALSMAETFKCRELYVYAMGQEPWLRFISSIRYDSSSKPIVESERLIEELRARGISAERLYGCKECLAP